VVVGAADHQIGIRTTVRWIRFHLKSADTYSNPLYTVNMYSKLLCVNFSKESLVNIDRFRKKLGDIHTYKF